MAVRYYERMVRSLLTIYKLKAMYEIILTLADEQLPRCILIDINLWFLRMYATRGDVEVGHKFV